MILTYFQPQDFTIFNKFLNKPGLQYCLIKVSHPRGLTSI